MIKNLSTIEENFKKNGFDFYSFKNREDLNNFLLEDLEENSSLYFGGSKTLEELGTFDLLNRQAYNLNWHWKKEEEVLNKNSYDRTYYLTSSNALTQDGRLVNMDGLGNRVAAMIRGYDRVYVIAGKNKLVENLEEARERIRNIAAPLNARRLEKATPCVETGYCMDCNSPERICRAEVILHRCPMDYRIVVCLLDEELGF